VLAVNRRLILAAAMLGGAIAMTWPGIRDLFFGLPLVRKQR
jgi:hypothetical protein